MASRNNNYYHQGPNVLWEGSAPRGGATTKWRRVPEHPLPYPTFAPVRATAATVVEDDVFASGKVVITKDDIHAMVQELTQMEDDQCAAATESNHSNLNNAAADFVPHSNRDALDFFLSNSGFVPYNPAELDCRGCTVLREIQHRNGFIATRSLRLHAFMNKDRLQ
uniref:Uncharacterized protein n=1 Tax=Oryza sativa subsp. japonica TaxID=39947 RepID=Q6EQW1_ORYSJ|nr:hypothetical protein [Oryza sativa Japonica Group]